MVRRMVGLPVVLLVALTAVPAQANVPPPSKTVSPCYSDPNTGNPVDLGTFTVTVKRDETADPDVHLLHRFTVNSACDDSWMRVRFIENPPGQPYHELLFYVQPGAVRTVGAQALQKLGYYQWSFYRYGAATGPGVRHLQPPPCVYVPEPPDIGGFILATGQVYRPPPCPSP